MNIRKKKHPKAKPRKALWKKEQEEHPWLTKAQAKRVVREHQKKKR